MLARTNFIAEPLASALNFKESPAVSVGANNSVAGLKKFQPKDAIEDRPNSEANVGVHFCRIREFNRMEHVYQFADHNSCINLWGSKGSGPDLARAAIL